MQSVENKIINRVYGNGRGWAFFKNDFLDLGSAGAVDQTLGRLMKSQRIRRVKEYLKRKNRHEGGFFTNRGTRNLIMPLSRSVVVI